MGCEPLHRLQRQQRPRAEHDQLAFVGRRPDLDPPQAAGRSAHHDDAGAAELGPRDQPVPAADDRGHRRRLRLAEAKIKTQVGCPILESRLLRFKSGNFDFFLRNAHETSQPDPRHHRSASSRRHALLVRASQADRRYAKAADASPSILKLDEASITKVELKKKDAEPIVLPKTIPAPGRSLRLNPIPPMQRTFPARSLPFQSLNSERVVEDKAADLKHYGLNPPYVEVDITEKDNKSQKLLLGDDTPAGSAVYAMLAGDPRVFTIAELQQEHDREEPERISRQAPVAGKRGPGQPPRVAPKKSDHRIWPQQRHVADPAAEADACRWPSGQPVHAEADRRQNGSCRLG